MTKRKPPEEHGKPGRPRKTVTGQGSALTVANAALFLAHIRAGLFRATAAGKIGLWPRTVDGWVAKGKKEIAAAEMTLGQTGEIPKLKRYGQFVIDLLRAEADRNGTLVQVMYEKGAAGDAKAAEWYLSRADNLTYGSGSQRTDIPRAGEDGDGVDDDDIDARVMTSLRALVRQEAERAASTE